jgi:hypothetical protein
VGSARSGAPTHRGAGGGSAPQFVAEGLGKLPPGVTPPFTDAARAEMRKQRTGRPLNDILRDLDGGPPDLRRG